jgi:uncharacterized protein (TIGR00299 family) protein
MRILYYDCFAGISGDMNLGAMIDLGVEVDYLKNELAKLPVYGYNIKVEKDSRRGITGTRIHVMIDKQHDHGHENAHNSFEEIVRMINASKLDGSVKSLSVSIFSQLAEAEAKVHNKPVGEVHFHEVGAVDSIIDIVGAAICLYCLAPDAVYCSTVELGGGLVKCIHGTYPVPAPATAEIIKNIPVRKGTVDYEATTPTGAAILAACVNEFTDKIDLNIIRTGYGIGTKDSTIPNVLRVYLCETASRAKPTTETQYIVECNIDDMNPEFYDYIIDSLFESGAKDVYITPIIMKKSRPAVKLSVLCPPEAEQRVNEVLFKETSTLGVRRYLTDKTMLDRQIDIVNTSYGEVRIKTAYYKGKCIKSKPEYDDCIKIARDKGIPINQVYREVEQLLGRKTEPHDLS